MNSRQLRLVLGFLAVFVLISIAPMLPDLGTVGSDLIADVSLTDGLGNLLLVCAGGLVLSVGVIAARRRWLARERRPRQAAAKAPARALVHGEASRPSGAAAVESPLTRQLRKESERGCRVPELARKFGLSQDAVRGALGRSPTAPAARAGSSFRDRKPASPPAARAKPVSLRRSPYQVTA